MRIWTLHIVLSVLFSVFLFSCNEDDGAPYPSVRLEFLTAESGADGRLQTLVTDKGERLVVAEDRTESELLPNSSISEANSFTGTVLKSPFDCWQEKREDKRKHIPISIEFIFDI